MIKNIQQKTVNAVSWSMFEQIGNTSVKFLLGIVLARLLLPSDFGLIGMVMVVFNVANELIQGGFAQAYIQKKNTNHKDAATVFYFNLVVSILLYLCLWILAPYIASFYDQPQLVQITRVMSIVVIIDAISIIQVASIMKKVDFKKKTLIVLVSNILSGITAISLAYLGHGIWALVYYHITNKLLNAVGLWLKSKSILIKHFSFTSLKTLFSYGSWLMLSSLLKILSDNISVIFIGKFFPAAELGFYSKSKQFQQMASVQILVAISSVAFPVFSLINSDTAKLRVGIQKFLQQSMLITVPIITALFVVADLFVLVLLTDKWAPMVPFLKLFCLVGLVFPINAINTQLMIALGESKFFLKITLIKNILRITNIVIMYRYGVLFIIAGEAVIAIINLFINAYISKKRLKYGLFKQLNHLKYHFIGAICAVIVSSYAINYINNIYLSLVLGTLIVLSVFYLIQFIFQKEIFNIILERKYHLINKIKR